MLYNRNEPGKETLPHSSVPLDQVELKKDTGGGMWVCSHQLYSTELFRKPAL